MLAQATRIDYPGLDGFLGTRASLMLDIVFVAMFVVIVVLGWSIALVRRGHYRLHKRIQLVLGVVLLVVIVAFEVDIRLHGWQARAAGSIGGEPSSSVWAALYVHLVFAISTAVLWPMVIYRALRRFPSPPVPGEHSKSHRFWARLAALDMLLTSITGWIFYVLAFAM